MRTISLDIREQRIIDSKKLRNQFGGDDRFMGAYQIKKIRTRAREIPEWTLNDKEVQKVLLRAFPGQHKSFAVTQRAGRWARIIHFYFRMQMSAGWIASELKMTPKNVELAVARIRRVARGYRADNTGPRGVRRPGRPRKSPLPQGVENT